MNHISVVDIRAGRRFPTGLVQQVDVDYVRCITNLGLHTRKLWRNPPGLTTIIMTLDPVLELSVEQLVRALNKKLLMECTRV